MSLEIPTFAQLRLAAQQDMIVEVNGSLGSRIRQAIAYALAAIGYAFLLTLKYLSRQFFVDTADDSYALLHADEQGIVPNPATSAQGDVQVTGVPSAILAGGEILQRSDGAQYAVDAPGELGLTGEATISISAIGDWVGLIGNTVPGTVLTFVAPPAGVNAPSTVLAGGLVDGFDPESIASVKERTLAKIRSPQMGGSEEDYEVWATSISGIATAYARGSFAGIGSVLVIVAKAWDPTDPLDSPIPSASLIADVEVYLETKKPAGLYLVAVQPPTLETLDPYIELDPDTPAIRDAVTQSLALALARVEPGGTAYYDDLVIAIDRAAGEVHHLLSVSDGVAAFGPYNTTVGYTALLIPGTPIWTAPP